MKILRKLLYIFFFLVGLCTLLTLDYFGIIWHNAPFAYFYSVKGLDVSSYQGDINWEKVAKTHKYSFVYIKATEGHDYTDDYFNKNWREAQKNGFLVGAYHFFSLRSSGKEQADLIISMVPHESTALPPLIDVEVDITKDPTHVRNELQSLANELEKYYGKKPILYVTYETYNPYIKGYFDNYQIWIRDVFKPPSLRNWRFWQYSNRGRVDGINGFVDINVFNGDVNELRDLTSEL